MAARSEPLARSASSAVLEAVGPGSVQPTAPGECDQIRQIATSSGVFNPVELDTVEELLDAYFRDPQESGYYFLSYRDGDRVLGFAAWGPRDLAERGYDLYWIATRPEAQRRGVARALLDSVETIVRERGGGWIWIETSDTPPYSAARSFYARRGYRRMVALPDFYRDGDGLVVYTKCIG